MRLVEIYEAVQGEGPDVGRRCVFVRLAGCNRRCGFCDTSYAWDHYIEVTVDEVVEAVERYRNLNYVVITGGEPMMQEEEVYWLTEELQRRGFEVALETNGDYSVDVQAFDVVVVSPKDITTLRKWLGNLSVTIKVVVDEENVDEVMASVKEYGRADVYFMPEGVHPLALMERSQMILEKMREYEVDGYICPRMHILMGWR